MNDVQPLPPRALTLMRLRALAPAGFIALLLLVAAVAAFVGDVDGHVTYGVVFLAIAAVVLAAWWVFVGLVYRSYGWKLTDGTVELQRGVIVKRHFVLPRARVQNVTQSAGPVARTLGLATVTVHSAGANTPNITVPDLTTEVGDWLRTNLLPSVRA